MKSLFAFAGVVLATVACVTVALRIVMKLREESRSAGRREVETELQETSIKVITKQAEISSNPSTVDKTIEDLKSGEF